MLWLMCQLFSATMLFVVLYQELVLYQEPYSSLMGLRVNLFPSRLVFRTILKAPLTLILLGKGWHHGFMKIEAPIYELLTVPMVKLQI